MSFFNRQRYINAIVVLLCYMNSSRVKMNFPHDIFKKFSLQDTTLTEVCCLLAVHTLCGFSMDTMINEEKKVWRS